MSRYFMGIDFGAGNDISAYTVVRKARWYEKLWCKLRGKEPWKWKVVGSWTHKEPTPKKYRRDRSTDK